MKNKELFNKNVGSILKKHRERSGLTLLDVSKRMNRALSTISDNERGVNDIPFSVIVDYCEFYGIDINELISKALKE